MGTSGDVAEQVVRLSIDGIEVVARLSGEGIKNLAVFLIAAAQSREKTSGQERLKNMLKNYKNLEIFSVRESDIEKFSQEAKRYGILYCALTSKKRGNPDGVIDIMVRPEDAPKVNRITERFKLAIPCKAQFEQMERVLNKTEKTPTISEKSGENVEKDIVSTEIKANRGKLISDEMMDKHFLNNNDEMEFSSNMERTEVKSNQLENYSKSKDKKKTIDEKPSVREKLKKFELECKVEANEKILQKSIEKNIKGKER